MQAIHRSAWTPLMHASPITRLKRLSLVALIALGAGGSRPLLAQERAKADSASVAQTARAFLVAFDSLRWEPFAEFWSLNATVFLPDAESPHLLIGRTQVLNYFQTLFDDVRNAAKTTTPNLGIVSSIHDLRIHLVAPTTALVTFELGRGNRPGRRTTLWQWDSSSRAWQLVHLHASTLTANQ